MKIELRKVTIYLVMFCMMMTSVPALAEETANDNPAPVQQQEITTGTQQSESSTAAPEGVQPGSEQPETSTNASPDTGQ